MFSGCAVDRKINLPAVIFLCQCRASIMDSFLQGSLFAKEKKKAGEENRWEPSDHSGARWEQRVGAGKPRPYFSKST